MARPLTDVDRFLSTMPHDYASRFGGAEIRAHAEAVAARPDGRAHVAVCGESGGSPSQLCVVCEDTDGQLPRISAALVAHDVDIVSAEVFRRAAPGRAPEIVEILEVRRASDPAVPLPAEIAEEVERTLDALAAGARSLDEARPPLSVRPPALSRGYDVTLRFSDDETPGVTTLTLEAQDAPGLLLLVTRALFHAGLQIVGLRAATRDGRAIDTFQIAERDGSPVRGARRFELQTALLSAIEEGRAPS